MGFSTHLLFRTMISSCKCFTREKTLIVWSVYYLIPCDCRGHKLKLIYFSRSQVKKIRNQLDSVQFLSVSMLLLPVIQQTCPQWSSDIKNFDHPPENFCDGSGKTLLLGVKVHSQLSSLYSPDILVFQ